MKLGKSVRKLGRFNNKAWSNTWNVRKMLDKVSKSDSNWCWRSVIGHCRVSNPWPGGHVDPHLRRQWLSHGDGWINGTGHDK